MPRKLRLGHISDLHCTGSGIWQPEAWDAGVEILNGQGFDAVLVTGDFTDWGLRHEWEQIVPKLEEIRAPKITCLGNQGARREGWRVYEELLGRERYHTQTFNAVTLDEERIRVELVKFYPDGNHEASLIADACIGERWGGEGKRETSPVYEAGLSPEGPGSHSQGQERR